ncbi:MAG: InlB B-repeat-containing protein, partial [Clostridia bacterium]|nr:InlB B-repeat-containing protein [Clostridia bacterium]
TAHTGYQMLFSHYGSMVIDNLSLKTSGGNVLLNCDFENRTAAENYMGDGLGSYTVLSANTLKFDLNGGTGSFLNQIKLTDIPLAITSAVPEKDGFTFLGWSTSKTASEPEYLSGGTYTANSSATLYAVWQEGGVHEHDFGQWKVETAPTCTDTGTEIRVCSVCGAEENRTVPATGHTEGETEVTPPTCTENGRSLVCCTVCGYHISDVPILATGHKFVSGVCTVCGEVDPDYIAGDIDLDGKVTAKDVNVLKKTLSGSENLTGTAADAADVNGDGKVTVADINLLKKKVTGEQ